MSEELVETHNESDATNSHEKSQIKSGSVANFNDFATPVNAMLVDSKIHQYMNQSYDKNNWWVFMDHSYARPWDWRPESTFLRPTKTLFIPKPNKRKSINPLAQIQDSVEDDLIDVEGVPEDPPLIYDKVKVKTLMEECEKHAGLARVEDGNEDWEETISRINWSPTQNRLFNGMVNILNNHHLGRLAYTDAHNEAICRRTVIDKSVERVRKLFATIGWDTKFIQWLHQLMIDNLNTQYLAAYLDILQSLKSKLPTFVDKFMTGLNSNKLSILSYESLFPLLKRPWDPVAQSLLQDKPKKLPGNPIIVIVPSIPANSKRTLKWINLLSNLGTVVTIPSNYGSPGHKMTMTTFVDQMFVGTRGKIQDIRADYPGRSIVLVGFNAGATLALQIAQIEQVLCVICLGFSLLTAEGKRGEPDDNLMELQCPVLFVIGQCSNTSLQEDMEDLRERMRVETGLIVVGCADDYLRVNKKKKRAEGITQSVVDRCIADEVGEFVSGVIMSPYPPQIRQSPTSLVGDNGIKKMKSERKRYNSNTSSLDSEPPSPTPRITRPGQNNSPLHFGRPPGSKSKNKWITQGIPPSPSTSPPPHNYTTPPDTSSNDSFLTDKSDLSSLKKIKTLKPIISAQPTTSNNTTSLNKNQSSIGKSIGQGRSLSSLLQGEIQTNTTKISNSGIKVLENVKISPGFTQKVFSNRTIEMSKVSLLNSTKGSTGSIVLLPDGKIKTISSSGGRYITSKRQLIGNKPPKPVKKLSYIPTNPVNSSNLPPPTNLTTQDIMDLPIIFADDNQIIENPSVKSATQLIAQPSKIISTSTGNKFVLINKQISLQNNSNFIISPSSVVKKTVTPSKIPPKYAKVVVSSKRTTPVQLKQVTSSMVSDISNIPDISVKKVEKPARATNDNILDLENEIAASTVFKPNMSDAMNEKKHMEELRGQKRVFAEIRSSENDVPPSKIAKVDEFVIVSRT